MSVLTFHGATLGICEWDLAATEVIVHNGVPLFLTAAGVEGFDPEVDAPASSVETGDLTLTPNAICTATRAYVTHQADGPMTLTATAAAEGSAVATDYDMPLREAEVERTRIVRFGRGPRGVTWSFRFAAEAARWALSGCEVQIERIKRRY